MPNVLFTQKCTRACPYCFANKHMAESAPDDIISWEDLIYVADFLQSSGERRFHILGGEPSLHPEFNAMVLYLLERGFDITVFSNGIMNRSRLEESTALFRDLPRERLTFVCNLNSPSQTPAPKGETGAARRFLEAHGERIIAGFNIYRTDFELDFLFDLINTYGLQRTIRIGLTHPIPGESNSSISLPDIDKVIDRLFSYRDLFERLRIKPGLDCGFPLCRFTDDQLAWLYRNTGGKYDFGCGPVVDIGPDLSVWSCFPISNFRQRSLLEFDNLQQIHEFYAKFHESIRTEVPGIYESCDGCRFREEKLCAGGCLAHGLSRFKEESHVRLQEAYS